MNFGRYGRLARLLGLRGGNAAIRLATAVVLARLLGPADYGVYVFAISLMLMVAIPLQAGLPVLAIRELSAYLSGADWARINGMLARMTQLILLSGAAVIAVALPLLMIVDWPEADRAALLWALVLLPGIALVNVTGASIRALRHVTIGYFLEGTLRPLLLLVAAASALVLLGPEGLSAPSAMAFHAGAACLAAVIALGARRRLVSRRAATVDRTYRSREWLRSLLPLSLMAGAQVVLSRTDMVMLRSLSGPEAAGCYNVALQGAVAVMFAFEAVKAMSGPRMATFLAEDRREDLQETFSWGVRIVLAGAVPVSLGLLLYGKDLIGAVFGAEYLPAYPAMVVLAAGAVLQASLGPVNLVATLARGERVVLAVVAVAALANIGLNAVLIPRFGIEGAAAASVLSLAGAQLVLAVWTYRRLGLTCLPMTRRSGAVRP